MVTPGEPIPGSERDWYSTVRRLTEALVAIRAVSPSADELHVARAIYQHLLAGDVTYDHCEVVPIPNDPYGRANVVAVIQGQRREAIVLSGHFDTVGTGDYGALEGIATDPVALTANQTELLDGAPLLDSDDWLFGRGAADMKSGIAIMIALMRHFAELKASGTPPPLTLVMLACADEEVQSAGMMAGMTWLAELRRQENLNYLGLINTDYVTARYPGDTARMIYTGSVGKVLPLLYVVGRTTHAGAPFDGIDANLIVAELVRQFSLNSTLADRVGDDATEPPVVLHQGDLKATYNTQTAHEAWLYLNVFILRRPPNAVMRMVKKRAERALEVALAQMARAYARVYEGPVPSFYTPVPKKFDSPSNVVYFLDIYDIVEEIMGREAVDELLAQVRAECPPTMDQREVTLHMIRALWQKSGKQGPAIIVALAPPYYPAVASPPGRFKTAVESVAARYAGAGVMTGTYFPLLSDMSYALPISDLAMIGIKTDIPQWGDNVETPGPHYTIPIDAMRKAAIPAVANIGPYGMGAHQRGERVYMPYSFAIVPRMILEVIAELARGGSDMGWV